MYIIKLFKKNAWVTSCESYNFKFDAILSLSLLMADGEVEDGKIVNTITNKIEFKVPNRYH